MSDNDLVDLFTANRNTSGYAELSTYAYCLTIRELKAYLDIPWTGLSLLDVRAAHVDGYLQYLRSRGNQARTLARKAAALKAFYRYLHLARKIAHDPTKFVRIRWTRSDVPRSLPGEIVDQMLKTAYDAAMQSMSAIPVRTWAILEILYDCLLRPSKVSRLDLGDIDWETGRILVNGKYGKQRYVPLIPVASRALNFYLEHARARLLGSSAEKAVFVSHRGHRLGRGSIGHAVKVVRPSAYPYCMRHSGAKHMRDNGAKLEDIQLLLGHTEPSSTVIYTEQMSLERLAADHRRFHPRADRHPGSAPPEDKA